MVQSKFKPTNENIRKDTKQTKKKGGGEKRKKTDPKRGKKTGEQNVRMH